MSATLSKSVYGFLSALNIKISENFVDSLLRTHPDYPSLLSITDTLDELKIPNLSLVADKEKLNELPVPFLTHSFRKGGEFLVVNDIDLQIIQDKEFQKNWNGIVVLAEKTENWSHDDNEKALAKEKALRYQIFFTVIAIILTAGLSLFNQFSFLLVGLILTTLSGLGISILIIQQELGISNAITDQICNAGANTDCNKVIHSEGSKLSKWLNWADVGIIYFASFLILLISNINIPILSVLSITTIPFIIFSLYYQWQIVKKWCTLCLLILGVLILQFTFLTPSILNLFNQGVSSYLNIGKISTTFFVFLSIAVTWQLILKPALKKNTELSDNNNSLLRFKNSPEVFQALLIQQKKVDVTPFENDLQLGNPDAPIQLMVACNPYCAPCAKSHEILHHLVERNDVGLTIRFSVNAENKEDKRTKAIEYLLQLAKDENYLFKRNIIQTWYENMDLEKFKLKYPLYKKTDISHLLQQMEQWVDKSEIQVTPTVFINGYLLSKQYRLNELFKILRKEETTVK